MTADRYAEGFRDGRSAAAKACMDFAAEIDTRGEEARMAGASASKSARRLRQVAGRIHSIPVPGTIARSGVPLTKIGGKSNG